MKKGHQRRIIVEGDIAKIELTQGKWALIDAEDVEKVKARSCWYENSDYPRVCLKESRASSSSLIART